MDEQWQEVKDAYTEQVLRFRAKGLQPGLPLGKAAWLRALEPDERRYIVDELADYESENLPCATCAHPRWAHGPLDVDGSPVDLPMKAKLGSCGYPNVLWLGPDESGNYPPCTCRRYHGVVPATFGEFIGTISLSFWLGLGCVVVILLYVSL